jgi:hypothetical protein
VPRPASPELRRGEHASPPSAALARNSLVLPRHFLNRFLFFSVTHGNKKASRVYVNRRGTRCTQRHFIIKTNFIREGVEKPSYQIPAVSAAASLRRIASPRLVRLGRKRQPSGHSNAHAPRLARNFGNFAAEKTFSTPSYHYFFSNIFL